ncbi:hypothetical protein BTR23_08230 [Alkalihalophilus pseudofirmus]|uniref:hypothetical protein n=1 Tax=Alkalihalobacterium alkalinitrilicum TaxID=427920 RepID=UPI00094D6883|nr:hypothetical protein [Alkalihalobacterium alkalinitrilicum]OLO40460.1 hypothetical protein BTR23_08230 [Alkalihalophilus pseudofirmus]
MEVSLDQNELQPLVYAICDEIVNGIVGYANTLLAVHAGVNSYEAQNTSDRKFLLEMILWRSMNR